MVVDELSICEDLAGADRPLGLWLRLVYEEERVACRTMTAKYPAFSGMSCAVT